MSEVRTSIILDLAGNLAGRARKFGGELSRLGTKGSRSMRMLGRATGAASRGLDRLGNRYTALLTGAAGVGAVRMVANLEERFVRLGIQANKSADEIDGLKKEIYDTAMMPDVRLDPAELTSAVEKIVEKTGDLDLARDNLRNIALAIQATGAAGSDIGAMIADMQEKFGLSDKDAFLAVLDTLVLQGKAGAFTLQNMATQGERVTSAYAAIGRTGPKAVREMGALLQMSKKGTGSPEQAATAFERMIAQLKTNAPKIKKAYGIEVWDPEQLALGKDVARSVPKVIKEIMRATKGNPLKLLELFGDEGVRALTAIQIEFQQTGAFDTLDKFMAIQGDGITLTKDSIRAAKTFTAALRNLYTVWQLFAEGQLTEPIKKLTEYLDGLKPGTVERWLKIGGGIAVAMAGLIAINKVGQAGRGIIGMFRGGGKAGAAGLAGAAGFGSAIPVYVVNGPASIWPGAKGAAGTGATAAGAGRMAIMGTMAAPLAPVAIAATAAVASKAIGKALAEHQARSSSTAELQALRARHMVMGGGPDSYQVRLIDQQLALRAALDRPTPEMSGELKISIDAEGRPKLQSMHSQGLNLDVSVGRLMASH